MNTQTIFRFALLGALLSSVTATAPAFAQKEDRNGRSGTAKEDRNESQNRNKEARGGGGTNKSDRNEGSNKGRKERR